MSLNSFIFENMTPIERVVVEPSDVAVNVKSPDEVPFKTPKEKETELERGNVKKQKNEKGKMNRIPLNIMLSKARKGKKIDKNRAPVISSESE